MPQKSDVDATAEEPKNPHGIFCLETIWFDERSNPSTRSLLELLESYGASRDQCIPFVYRDVSTKDEMEFLLGRWVDRSTKRYQLADLGILYLGFHGSPGRIFLRQDTSLQHDNDEVDLEQIGDMLEHEDDKHDCSGAVIHFASCSVLQDCGKADKFRKRVRAACVSGYTGDVETTPSWAFELMYLELLSDLLRKKNVNSGTLGTLEKRINSKPEYKGLAKTLGFKMIY